jgi:hypothetical protein
MYSFVSTALTTKSLPIVHTTLLILKTLGRGGERKLEGTRGF